MGRVGKPDNSGKSLHPFVCNLDTWWRDEPFLRRMELAAQAGFDAIELWSPTGSDRDPAAIASVASSLGLRIAQFTAWFGPSLAERDNHRLFIDAMERAVSMADQFESAMFTVVGHESVPQYAHLESIKHLTEALVSAAPVLESAGKTLLLEPFNPSDHEGFFLNGSADALEICRAVDSSHVRINWDLYHMELAEGDVTQRLIEGFEQVGYLQIADVPGRHEPGTGALDLITPLRTAKKLGYDGEVGLEFWPLNGDEERAITAIRKLSDQINYSDG